MATNRVLFERFLVVTLVATFGLMMAGGYVKAMNAGLACPDWPKCYGVWFPFGDNAPQPSDDPAEQSLYTMYQNFGLHRVAAEWGHRWLASMVGPMILAVAIMAWRLRPVERRLRFFAVAALVLLPFQALLGGFTVLAKLKPLITVSHLAGATLIFGSLVATTVLTFTSPHRPKARPAGSAAVAATTIGLAAVAAAGAGATETTTRPEMSSRPWTNRLQELLGPWFQLIKPGILFLLVLMGLAAMFLAGTPSAQLVAVTLFGGGLAAASAAAFNNYFDRHRDAQMARTKKRPVPSSRIAPGMALGFAFLLEVASFSILWFYANLLTAALALASVLFYIWYTVWLKPATVQNIVIGGAAGAGPALVGWAAVTGEIALPAVVLGSVIFLWTPPHFWALALVYKKDYEQAAVPMYPVVKGDAATRNQILLYSVLTVAASLLFLPLGTLGAVYGAAAALLGGWFVWLAVKLHVKKDLKTAYALFAYSIAYLALLFGAMVVDRLLVG